MKHIIFLALVLSFVSCGGKGGSSGAPSTSQNSVEAGLTVDEKKLINELTENSSLEQKKFLKIILKYEKLQQVTFNKMDKYLNIDCSASQGICHITKKAQ